MSVAPHSFDPTRVERVAASMLAARAYEGAGHYIHDSYIKSTYIKRRHGFLGNHPDFMTDPKLYASVTRAADQVFTGQADEMSVEKVRTLELVHEIDPLLPLPTSTNTATLDNFRSTGTKEWTAETGHPKHYSPSPTISAIEPSIEDPISQDRTPYTPPGLGTSVSGPRNEHSSAAQTMRHPQQTNFADPASNYPTQQTRTNMSSQHQSISIYNNIQGPQPSAMDYLKVTSNVPEDQATLRKIISDLGKDGLTAADCPVQYHDPQMQRPLDEITSGASALATRPTSTSVKPQNGNKRAVPVDIVGEVDVPEEVQTAVNQSKKPAPPPKKKVKTVVTAGADGEIPDPAARPIATKKPIATKAPRQRPQAAKEPEAAPLPAESKPATKPRPKGKERAKPKDSSVTSTVSEARPARGKARRPTVGGKAPPEPSSSATPASTSPRRVSHPEVVAGTRLPRSKSIAEEAAVERRQALLSKLLKKKPSSRYSDLGPEFFDTNNFTTEEKDPNGEPPVRCVCGLNVDDGKYTGGWVGCDNNECRVWQHVTCMGEAVPPGEAIEEIDYLCQQCDPYAHRKLIQKLRKEQPIV